MCIPYLPLPTALGQAGNSNHVLKVSCKLAYVPDRVHSLHVSLQNGKIAEFHNMNACAGERSTDTQMIFIGGTFGTFSTKCTTHLSLVISELLGLSANVIALSARAKRDNLGASATLVLWRDVPVRGWK